MHISRATAFPGSMQRALVLLVLVVLLPLLLLQGSIYWSWARSRETMELQANLEVARSVGATFQAMVRDVQRQALAVGAALARLKPDSPEETNQYLAHTAKEYVGISNWYWVDPEGRILGSTEPRMIGRNVAHREYYRDIVGGRQWAVSDLVQDQLTDRPIFVIARRIEDHRGELAGLVLAAVEPEKLVSVTLNIERPDEGAFALFDRQGNLVHFYRGAESEMRNWRAVDPVLDAALGDGEEHSGTVVLPFDDRPRLVVRVPVDEFGWVAGASRPVSVVMAAVYRGVWLVLGLNLLVILVTLSIAAWIGRRIVGGLGRLQEHARAIGRGELAHRTEIAGLKELGELGELAAAFNRMGEQLGEARAAQEQANALLEQRVEERTADLAGAVTKLEAEVEQRRRAEQALREQSRVLEAFFLNTLTSLAILDRNFNFMRVNETYAKACVREVSAFPGQNHFELYPHEENEAIFREVVRTKTPYETFAKPFTFPDHPEWGTTYWNWTLVPISDESGEVEFLVFSLQDVTERTRTLQALRDSEARYRSLTLATTEIVWTTDPMGLVTGEMESWRAFTGQSLREVQGAGWSEALHPDDRGRTLEVWNRAVEKRGLYETEYRMRRRDGEYRHVTVRGVPVLNDDGTLREWVGTCKDITERRLAEEELALHRQHLEELVAQRTGELRDINSRLQREIAERRQTAEELARSNRDLEQFAYVASHDLQEPLRVVAGYLQLLERRYKEKLDADADRFIDFAVDGAARMQQLITDLLDFSRVGTRGKPLTPTNMGSVLQRTLQGLRKTIEETGAKVTHDVMPTVQGDEIQLVQVLQNLIANGIKFRREDCAPTIHISAREEDEHWVFTVRDNGIGIEKQYWEQIFVIFQRLHTRKKYSGTGIGLAICKKIVERHGGRMWLESEPGQGSAFYFTVKRYNSLGNVPIAGASTRRDNDNSN